MRIQRLIGLLCVLAEVDKITVQELADKFEVSKRTIFRDLDTLNCAGIPIVSYPGVGGGVSVIEGYKIDKKILSTDDTQKIFTALNGLKSIDSDNAVNSLLAKLVPENSEYVFSQSEYVINLSSWFSDSIIHEKAVILHKAIHDNCCVVMEYVSQNSRCKRTVEPYKLIFKQSDWYLYAFCRERNDFRLFKLRRIISQTISKEKFAPREVKSIQFESDYTTTLFSAHPIDGFIEIVLEYDIQNEFALTQRIDASFFREVNKACNTARICFYTPNLSVASNLVFELLDKVRVISPPELYADIKSRLKSINHLYER